jgi:hypothetical protein
MFGAVGGWVFGAVGGRLRPGEDDVTAGVRTEKVDNRE